jgi:hypothetical protein
MPGEEIAITARPKNKSQSKIYRYGRSIFRLPHQPKISDFFDLCLHWVSVVRVSYESSKEFWKNSHFENMTLIWTKSEEKSVQLVRGSFVPK